MVVHTLVRARQVGAPNFGQLRRAVLAGRPLGARAAAGRSLVRSRWCHVQPLVRPAMSKKHLVAALLTTDDQDILDYVTGTVEQCVDDGDTSAEALTEALSDLLISYELAPDEQAAAAICASLSEQLSGSEPVAPQAEQRPKLLSAPVQMGEDRADEALISLTSRPVNVDAMGNSCSMAARANAAAAAAAAAKEGPPSKKAAEAKAEPDAGASGPAFGLLHATALSKAEQAARDSAELEAGRREREAACERYLLSKAAGGSRDVAIKGLILLAPTGKPLIDGGDDGEAKLQLVAGRRYGLVGRNGTGKSTLLKAIASYEIQGFPQHLKVRAPPARRTPHAARCTLHAARCTLHAARRTPHAAPCTLHAARCTLQAARCTLQAARRTLHAARCTLHAARRTLHPARCTLHPARRTLHPPRAAILPLSHRDPPCPYPCALTRWSTSSKIRGMTCTPRRCPRCSVTTSP